MEARHNFVYRVRELMLCCTSYTAAKVRALRDRNSSIVRSAVSNTQVCVCVSEEEWNSAQVHLWGSRS